MNRYAAAGIHADALAGMNVLVITRDPVRSVFAQLSAPARDEASTFYSHSLGIIDYGVAGRIAVQPMGSEAHRGSSFDK
uniref:hypothetical protein n=1 Tax=Pseudomonas sp. PS02285 TaxID=2991441 RepID=UPI00249BB9C3